MCNLRDGFANPNKFQSPNDCVILISNFDHLFHSQLALSAKLVRLKLVVRLHQTNLSHRVYCIWLYIYPIMRKRSKRYNELVLELPATCLPLRSGKIPLCSFKKTSRLVFHSPPSMLSDKQRSCEYQFYNHRFNPTWNQTRVTATEADALSARPRDLFHLTNAFRFNAR